MIVSSIPTPDPPPAAPLTAEEIAALREQYGPENGLVHYEPQIIRLLDENAALRDRLARTEEMLEDAHSTLYVLSQMAHNWANMGTAEEYKAMVDVNVVRAARMRKRIHALLDAPTDGAVRAGEEGTP